MWRSNTSIFAMLVCLASAPAFAQGQQSGAVGGRVSSADRLPLPGATVTVSSDALQGERTATTDINGIYSLPGLPPGRYRGQVRPGQHVVRRTPRRRAAWQRGRGRSGARAGAGQGSRGSARRDAGAGDVARRRQRCAATQIATAADRPHAVPRRRAGPGPDRQHAEQNRRSRSAGAFAYDNLFLMNGVDINDNVLGTPNNLFIEDAIQEVQVLTSGICAEYGRFSGGDRQRDHAQRRQRVLGRVPHQLHQPGVERRDPFEKSAGHVAREQAVADLRGDGRRPGPARSAVVLRRRPRRADDHADLRSRRRGFRTPARTTTRATKRS